MEEGEDRAFEDFCRSVYPKAVRTAYLMTGDRQEAMDLAQDALVRTLERWRIVRGMDRPDAWVHTVVVNSARSWARKRRVMARTLQHLRTARPIGDQATLEDPRLVLALQRLTPAQRRVVVLRYCVDLSTEDVANLLRVREGTVRALASQGLARLREHLRSME